MVCLKPLYLLFSSRILCSIPRKEKYRILERFTPEKLETELEMNWKNKLDEIECVLNKLTPKTYDLVEARIINSGITSADILQGVVLLIFDKAALEPTIYAQLCNDIYTKLPSFCIEGKKITFWLLLFQKCQKAFESADKLKEEISYMTAHDQSLERGDKERMLKLRTLGNIRFMGELFKKYMISEREVHQVVQKLFGTDSKICPDEENVEGVCLFLNTVGKQLDGIPKSKSINDVYFNQLNDLLINHYDELAPRMRSMVRDVIDLRSTNWGEEVNPKTITETENVTYCLTPFVLEL